MANYIYSELQNAILNLNYEGLTSSTAQVNIDQTQRTIEVDVTSVPNVYTQSESDNRYVQKSVEVLTNGATTTIPYSQISPYTFVIFHGYKNNVASPNQSTFIVVPKYLSNGESNLIVSCTAMSTNWTYGVVFTRLNDMVSWETNLDYGGDSQFIVTNIIGVY